MNHELEELTKKVCLIVEDAGKFIAREFGKVQEAEIELKDHNSLVSYVDKNAEEMLVTALSELIPSSGFITEEETVDNLSPDYIWIIDPLDGTTNFLYNIPHFSTSVALQYKGELVLGVITDIMRDDIYYAWKNGGAYMNNKKISVSSRKDFSNCVIGTGFPYDSSYSKKPYFEMLEVIMRDARGLRRFGSAALDMAYVACGRFDAFYETSLNPWDVAGGIVICKEAGSACSDYFDGKEYESGQSIIVANPVIQQFIVSYTTEFFDQEKIALQ